MLHRRKYPAVRRFLRVLAIAGALVTSLVLLSGAFFTLEVLSRKPVGAIASTTHPSMDRRQCIDCHAPIAEEWRQSYHHLSLTGPYWKDVRELGYTKIFDWTRKACVNCHAPANVVDLMDSVAATGPLDGSLDVECTPNLLREPAGVIPAARTDAVELGVDCTACHVGRHGIVGPGRRSTSEHEIHPDPRFEEPALTSATLCRTCHASAFLAWSKTRFASQGVTCIDCHMPATKAASTTGGPTRARRSHRFPGDKDPLLLEQAFHASLAVTPQRQARFRIINDGVGHYFPSGGNWLTVRFRTYDATGHALEERFALFGKDEPLLLDFWPFNRDRRIASGDEKEVLFSLPQGHGVVVAEVRYHDWMRTRTTVLALKEDY